MTAAMVQLIAHPIATAIRPKLNMIYQLSATKGDEMLLSGVKIISCLTIPASAALFFSSESIVLFLLGSAIEHSQLEELTSILRLLAVANALTSVSANLYYYQVALGNLRWHFISAVVHPIILLPILYFCIFGAGILAKFENSSTKFFISSTCLFIVSIVSTTSDSVISIPLFVLFFKS